MNSNFTRISIGVTAVVGFFILILTGSGCDSGTPKTTTSDSSNTAKVESFHDYFNHYGQLDEVSAFFTPEIMKTHRVKTAKFFDQFAGKPEFAAGLADEIKHFDSLGRIVKEEFLTIDSTSHAYGSESWKYDDAGRVIESRIEYPNSDKVTQVTYQYDADGRIVFIDTKAFHSLVPDTSVHFKMLHEISYVSKGNIPNKILHKKDDAEIGQVATAWVGDTLVYTYGGEEAMEIKFICDSLGRVLQMVEIDELPQAINKKHVFGYDASQRVNTKDEHVWMNGQYTVINKTVWTYNEKGLLSQEEVFAVKGQEKSLVDKSTIEYSYFE